MYKLLQTFAVFICIPLHGQNAVQSTVANKTPSTSIAQISAKELNNAASWAAEYMVRANHPDGSFVYEINILSGRQLNSYNVIRHSGAIYALSSLDDTSANANVERVIENASNFLKNNFVRPGPFPATLAVWSRPDSESDASLGSTAFGIIALASARRLKPEIISIEELEALGAFMLKLQQPNGRFNGGYHSASGMSADEEVLYYPGEAALGFLYLYDADGSQIWLDAAIRALDYLCKSRANLSAMPADSWALIATGRLLNTCTHAKCVMSPSELINHATKICRAILKEQLHGIAAPALAGGFDPSGRTTPTATRIEGLCAAATFLPDPVLVTQIRSSVYEAMVFLLQTQITTGKYRGGMPASADLTNQQAYLIRIDYVQHALSAMLAFAALQPRN